MVNMGDKTEVQDSYSNSERSDENIRQRPDGGDMTKEDRRQQVLKFMDEYPLALPPLLLYRNLRMHETVTFSVDSLRNYLEEFAEEGLVQRVEKEPLDDGRVVEAESGSRAYYLISDDGREYLSTRA